ncbi:hypothetical protein [Streptomyces nigra]|uniref:hypothetical protein n=1 Tax=Streptomyces nigra TaxID=1827580 RepID=UPI0036371556
MEQATQATTPTAPTNDRETVVRASYRRARSLADQLVDGAPVTPNAVETYRGIGSDDFAVRLHFGTGFEAGRGVLQIATLLDTQPIRDEQRLDVGWGGVVWIEAQTTVDGVQVLARALTNKEDADRLLPPADDAEDQQATTSSEESAVEVTQPMPTISTDPAAPVIPAVTPVIPLATAYAPAEAGE